MKKKLLKLAGIGFLVGIALSLIIAFIIACVHKEPFLLCTETLVTKVGNVPGAVALQLLLSGLFGSICFGGVILYDIEKWPLALPSLLHFLMIEAVHLPISLFLGWAQNITDFLKMAGIQLVGYLIIWIIMFVYYRKQVKELNRLQRALHERDRL